MKGKRNVNILCGATGLLLMLTCLWPCQVVGGSLVTNVAARDTYLRGDGAQLSDGSGLSVADWAGSVPSLTRHTVISFDLSSFDVSAGFLSAALKLGQPTSGAAGTHNVNRLLRDFIAAEADFNEYTTGNNWQTPGAVGASDSVQIAAGVASGDSGGGDWAGGGLDVTAAANAWVAAGDTAQLGFLLLPVTKYQNYVYGDSEGGNSPVLVFEAGQVVQGSIVTNLATRDTYLRGDGAQISDGTGLSVADWAGSVPSLTRHTVVSFDLSSFDVSRGFVFATLKLGQPTSGVAGTHNVNRLLRDFIAPEADFNEYTTGNNWQTPGAVGASDSVQIATGVASGDSGGGDWAGGGLDVTAAANAWVAAGDTAQLGFLILPVTTYQNYAYGDSEGGNSPVLVFQVVPAPSGTVLILR